MAGRVLNDCQCKYFSFWIVLVQLRWEVWELTFWDWMCLHIRQFYRRLFVDCGLEVKRRYKTIRQRRFYWPLHNKLYWGCLHLGKGEDTKIFFCYWSGYLLDEAFTWPLRQITKFELRGLRPSSFYFKEVKSAKGWCKWNLKIGCVQCTEGKFHYSCLLEHFDTRQRTKGLKKIFIERR